MNRILLIVSLMTLLVTTGVFATPTYLKADMTVDNGYSMYLSTDDSTLGTLVGKDTDWYKAESYQFSLEPGVTNYLHVKADDWGVISGFLGGYQLSNSDFHFANGTQALTTNTTDWNVSRTGFGSNYETPTSAGNNGVGPWGTFSMIPSNAAWIWTNHGNDINTTRYFSTPIFSNSSIAEVPEPMTISFLALAGMTAWSRRRKTSCS
jgi:hypothetical protein